MKKICFYTMLLMLSLTTGLTSCRDRYEEEASSNNTDSPEIVFSLSATGAAGSRTGLIDPGTDGKLAMHHVSRVVLYIYEDEKYKAAELVEWPEIIENNVDKNSGSKTVEKKHKLKFANFNSNSNYTFLAVGLDDVWSNDSKEFLNRNSLQAYGLYHEELTGSYGDEEDCIEPTLVDKPLTEAKATLRSGLHRGFIQASELFSGYVEVKGDKVKDNHLKINLFRRVAGVNVYFSKIPKQIGESEVKYLLVRLCANQNKTISLKRKVPDGYDKDESDINIPDNDYNDYDKSELDTDDGNQLIKFDLRPLSLLGPGSSGSGDGNQDGYQNVPDNPIEGDPNPNEPDISFETEGFLESVSKGVYVLPVKFDDSCYENEEDKLSTIVVELLDEYEEVLLRRRIVHKSITSGNKGRSGTGIIESANYRYPIRANNFYRIGSKDNPVTIDGSTSDIEVEIDNMWDEYYGGSIGDKNNGIGIDNEWGDNPAGSLDKK